MIYDYYCDRCQRAKDIIKPVSEYNTYEYCDCGFEMRKLFSVQKAIVDKIDAQFCPALGQVVKSNAERRQLAKERGLQEVGNEPAESLHKHFDKQREEKRSKTWDSVEKDWFKSDRIEVTSH